MSRTYRTDPRAASILVIDCGTLTGHNQTELEFPLACIPYFEHEDQNQERYIKMRVSSGAIHTFRLIHRHNNSMWRLELDENIPEIVRGIFPFVDGVKSRRSNCAAIFRKSDDEGYFCSIEFPPIGADSYELELDNCTLHGDLDRSVRGERGRNFGWY